MNEEIKSSYDYFSTALNELKTVNRFSNQKLDALVKLATSEHCNTLIVESGIFYRARVYNLNDKVEKFFATNDSPFMGYNEQDSFVNLKCSSEGRCNPQFIPYLYMADSVECCIAEVYAGIGQCVSVAEIKVCSPLRILDLAKNCVVCSTESTLTPAVEDILILLDLESQFSEAGSENYLLTQYLSEKIKAEGYDGIAYHSSKYKTVDKKGIGKNGCNFAIFNYNKCKAISSRLYKIDSITINASSNSPY